MRTNQQPPTHRGKHLEDLLVGILGGGLRCAWWLLKHPFILFVVVVQLAIFIYLDVRAVIEVAILGVAVLACWRILHRASFERVVVGRLRISWRRIWHYERHWRSVITFNKLALVSGPHAAFPRIHDFSSDEYADWLGVRMLVGQSPENYERAADALAHAFGGGCPARRRTS